MGGRIYLKEDKYRFATALATADVNLDIYGIGKAAGDNGTFVPLKTDGKAFIGEALFRLEERALRRAARPVSESEIVAKRREIGFART